MAASSALLTLACKGMLHDVWITALVKLHGSDGPHKKRRLWAVSEGRCCLPGARPAASPHDRFEPKPTAEDRALPLCAAFREQRLKCERCLLVALQADPLYRGGKVPGTCRLPTRVTVKPGARRHLTLGAFRRWVMQAPSQSEMPLTGSERCLSDALPKRLKTPF